MPGCEVQGDAEVRGTRGCRGTRYKDSPGYEIKHYPFSFQFPVFPPRLEAHGGAAIIVVTLTRLGAVFSAKNLSMVVLGATDDNLDKFLKSKDVKLKEIAGTRSPDGLIDVTSLCSGNLVPAISFNLTSLLLRNLSRLSSVAPRTTIDKFLAENTAPKRVKVTTMMAAPPCASNLGGKTGN